MISGSERARDVYEEDDAYTEEIIRKEAEVQSLTKEQQEQQREISHIKRSNTWKVSQPFRKIWRLLTKLFRFDDKVEQREQMRELQTKLSETEQELYSTREQLTASLLDDRKLTSFHHQEVMRNMKAEGKLVNYLDQAVQDKKKHEANYNEALIYGARLFMNEETTQKNLVYSKALTGLKTEDIPEFIIRAGLTEEDSIPLRQVASFRASLSMRMRQKQFVKQLPEFTLENKLEAYHFVDQLNVRRPEVTAGSFSLATIPYQAGTVIKPVDGAGSRGVYLIHTLNDIIDVQRAKQLDDLQALEESMQKDLTRGAVEENEWMVEELILEDKEKQLPASDLKFYCFYGKVGIILEITRFPERKHCWWTATGERVRTGKYEEALFKGTGVSSEELQLAADMSATIPAPFVRIDFLRSEEGLIFGEFTAKPGNYDDFDEGTDQWLGDYFLEAEGRLMNDLLQGKQFPTYNKFIKSLEMEKV